MTRAVTKAALLEMIGTEHANLEALLGGLSDEQMVRSGVEGQWSVKDIVAHLVFWEQLVADELKVVASGQTPEAIPGEEIQPLNERNFRRYQHRTLAQVRLELQRSMRDMLANVSALSEDVLLSACTWTDEGSVVQHVANEMGHWQDHMAVIRAWLVETQ